MLESLEGRRGRDQGQASAAGDRRSVRQADGRQQRPLARQRSRRSSPREPRPSANSGWGAPVGPRSSSSRATSSTAAIFEVAFGVSLGELVEEIGGGTASGRPVRAVQVGGPLGAYLPTSRFDLPMDYEAFAAAGAMVGHGGVVVFDDTVDMSRQARFAMEFCAEESCGKCTPCRLGAVRGVEVIDRIIAGDRPRGQPRAAGGPLRDDGRRLALCDGRPHALACAQRSRALPRGLRTRPRRSPL